MIDSKGKNGGQINSGRRVLITGAGSGIGKALAWRLAASGHRLALLGRLPGPLKEVAGRIGEGGVDTLVLEADVSREQEVRAAVERIGSEWGALDGLVNNAGITFFGTIEETPLTDWNRVLEVNLTGPFLVTRECLPWLRRGSQSAVVNVASTLGQVGLARAAAYCAAKAGLVNLTRVLALDHAAEGIRFNAVCPGVVDTPMLAVDRGDHRDAPGRRRDLEQAHPLGRVARPEEIAAAIENLLDPGSSFITGAVLTVDGGMTAGFAR